MGTRSSILYWKVRKNEIHYGVEGQKADRFIMLKDEGKFWLFGDAEGFRTNTFRGTKLLWHTPIPLRLVGDMYHDYKAQVRLLIRPTKASLSYKSVSASIVVGVFGFICSSMRKSAPRGVL